jgi:hypothetical protein
MLYGQYIQGRKAGTVFAGIDNSAAMKLVNFLPAKYKFAHSLWSWVCVLSIPVFIYVAIFRSPWVGLLLLFFVTPMIANAVKKSAAKFVLEHAESNKEFFDLLVKDDILYFKHKPNTDL